MVVCDWCKYRIDFPSTKHNLYFFVDTPESQTCCCISCWLELSTDFISSKFNIQTVNLKK